MSDNVQRSREKRLSYALIALCWIVYACSYVGKLSYNANITQIEAAYGVSHTQAGLVGTMFFFAYGVGQIFNGLLCKRYNLKYVVFSSLIVASLMNVLVVSVPDFRFAKYIWLINGAAMSFLWTALIRLLSETLGTKYLSTAIIVMGTTVATGTFAVYGLSSLFVAVGSFRTTFFVVGGVLLSVAVIWLTLFGRLTKPLYSLKNAESAEIGGEAVKSGANGTRVLGKGLLGFFAVIAVFAVMNNFVKDGLTSWTPGILEGIYATPAWLSILLTLALPMFAVLGVTLATAMRKKIKNYVLLCTVLYSGATVLVLTVILLLSYDALAITVIAFALVACLMASINNIITSMIPLKMRDQIDSGRTAGLLNGFCYLGSTLSTYGLGYVAENSGWQSVLYTLLALSGGAAVFGVICYAVTAWHSKRSYDKTEDNNEKRTK